MERKWEYISGVLRERGYDAAADLAQQIDDVLCAQYGLVHTAEWADEYESREGTLFDAIAVADYTEYCVACVIEKGRCDDCKFGNAVGRCSKDQSLFRKFILACPRNEIVL